jgi:hypothetical protein
MPQTLFTQICHRDVPMAIACFKSLEKAWQETWVLHVMEDGTVTAADWDQLRVAFPAAVFYRKSEVRDRIEQALSNYPACLRFYRTGVTAPKLLEAPFLSSGDVHFCDPDLLFFRRLERLWPSSPEIVFLCEKHGFSGYSLSIFDLVRHKIPLAQNVNVGLYRVSNSFCDLDKIEWFLSRSKNPLRPFMLEQTCYAFLAANVTHGLIAPDEILCTKELLPDTDFPPAIHFIADQKRHFWKYASMVDMALERDPVSELRTVEGWRVPWSRIGAQVVRGFRRRVVSAVSLKPRTM